MKTLLNKKSFIIAMGIVLCYTHNSLGKSKNKSQADPANIKNVVVATNSTVETLSEKDPLLFKNPLVKEYLALAKSYHQDNNYSKAIDFYTKALSMDEYNFNALKGLANISFIQKEFSRATDYYETIITLYPRCVSAHYNLGLCYLHNKRYNDASNELKKVVSLESDHHKAWCALGSSLEAENDITSAFNAYKKAIDLKPTFATAHCKLGLLYKSNYDMHNAIYHLQQALSLEKNNLHIMMELANLFNCINENEKALTLYVSILKSEPLNIAALYNCGFTLKKQDRIHEALSIYEKVLEIDPLYAKAHFARAHALLSLGNFTHGFKEYEWRFIACDQSASLYTYPLWDGSDLSGKTILVSAEQSIDDTIQFARYIPLLQKQGAHVIFQVQNSVKQLLQCSANFDTVIDFNQNPPYCDFQVPLMSLPYILKTTIDTIPSAPAYLDADEHLIAYWKSYLAHDNNLKIGIYWHDNETNNQPITQKKSIPLSILTQLGMIPNVSLYSLHRADQQEQYTPECVHSFGAHFDTLHGPFMDSAAVIKNLDLVISIDASVGHLAAALGVPTWILLPHSADWRWLIERHDSPWYPTVRLFRQAAPDDWNKIMSLLIHNAQILAQNKQRLIDAARFDSLDTQLGDNNTLPSLFDDEQDDSFLHELQKSMSLIVNKKS